MFSSPTIPIKGSKVNNKNNEPQLSFFKLEDPILEELRDNIIDVIIFHEGNISSDDQDYIKSHSYENIKFKNVSQYFINNNDLELAGENKFNLGYRQMCRFNINRLQK